MSAHRAWRMAAIGASVFAVGMLALIARTLNTAGVFSEVTPRFAGVCQSVPGAAGASDIAVDGPAGIAFVAAATRRPHASTARDGLYLVSLAHPERGAARLGGVPKDFHPRGISLYRAPDGGRTLLAVNVRAHGEPSVDIFDVGERSAADGAPHVVLTERASLRSSLFGAPVGIAAVGPDRFYLANARAKGTGFIDLLRRYVTPRDADIVYYDGTRARVVGTDLGDVGGLALSADRTKLYVTQLFDRDLRTYAVQPLSGNLVLKDTYPLPAGLAGIEVDANGALWIAGHPKLFAYARFLRDPDVPSPSEVFRVTVAGGMPDGASPVYVGLGGRIGAAGVAVNADGTILIGSALQPKLLACRPQ